MASHHPGKYLSPLYDDDIIWFTNPLQNVEYGDRGDAGTAGPKLLLGVVLTVQL